MINLLKVQKKKADSENVDPNNDNNNVGLKRNLCNESDGPSE